MMPAVHPGFSAKLLEPGERFLWSGKWGSVIEHRPDGYLIHWESYRCPHREETVPVQVKLHSWDEIARADAVGLLQVELADTMAKHASVPRYDRSVVEERRMQWRLAYVQAARDLIASGEMVNRRADFIAKFAQIQMLGSRRFDDWRRQTAATGRQRGGAVQDLGPTIAPPQSGAYLHCLYNGFLKGGTKSLYDSYRRSGWRGSHLTSEEEAMIDGIIQIRLDGERPSYASIVESVQAACAVHNKRIDPTAAEKSPLRIPGYKAVRAAIDRIAPIDHAIRRHGKAKAYRDMHAIGTGVATTRALERVEVDEYTLDVVTLLKETGVFAILPEDLISGLELDGKAARLKCSAAIDAHTRAILAMKFASSATADLFAGTVEMICSPKDAVFDGVTQMDWPMHGRPETIVVDRGSAYTADESYDLLADLGIVNQGAAAKKAWLRPFIERLFKTIHARLLQRFPGRTFGDVVKRGENDPSKRAPLTLEELLHWVLRWIVDIYHLTPHAGLNGATPYQAWERAVQISRPAGVPRAIMRRVFGTTVRSDLSREGVKVLGLAYTSPELYSAFARDMGKATVDVIYWSGDIGAVEVKLGTGRWLTVPATDERWTGKSLTELMAIRALETVQPNPEHEQIRYEAIADMDQYMARAKSAAGLIAGPRDADNLDRLEASFQRHTVSTAHNARRPESREFLGDEVQDDGHEAAVIPERDTSQRGTTARFPTVIPRDELPDDDLMD